MGFFTRIRNVFTRTPTISAPVQTQTLIPRVSGAVRPSTDEERFRSTGESVAIRSVPRSSGGGGSSSGGGGSTPTPMFVDKRPRTIPTQAERGITPTRKSPNINQSFPTSTPNQSRITPFVNSISAAPPRSNFIFNRASRDRESQVRDTTRLSLGQATFQAGKRATEFGTIGQQGFGTFTSNIFKPFNRVGVQKDFSSDLIPVRETPDPFGNKGTITKQKFIEVDTSKISFEEKRRFEDVQKGIDPSIAGLPSPVAQQRIGEGLVTNIQGRIDTGKITLEQGQSELDIKFKEQAGDFLSKRGTDKKLKISSGLGTKLKFGTEIGAIGLASTTPIGAGIVGGIFAGQGVKEFGKATLNKQLTPSERGLALTKGTLFTGIGFTGLGTGVFSRGSRGLLAQETKARQEFLINNVQLESGGQRFLTGKQSGVDIFKVSSKQGGVKLEGEFVIPFKVGKKDIVRTGKGEGAITITDKVPFTDNVIVTSRSFKNIQGKTIPAPDFLKPIASKEGTRTFLSSGSFEEGLGLQTIFKKGKKGGRLILGKGFQGREIAKIKILPRGKKVKTKGEIGTGLEVGDSLSATTGSGLFEPISVSTSGGKVFGTSKKSFVDFTSGKIVGSQKRVIDFKSPTSKVNLKTEELIRVKVSPTTKGRLEIIDLRHLDEATDITSTTGGGLIKGKRGKGNVQLSDLLSSNPSVALSIPKNVARSTLKVSAPTSQSSSFKTVSANIPASLFAGKGTHERTGGGLLPSDRIGGLTTTRTGDLFKGGRTIFGTGIKFDGRLKFGSGITGATRTTGKQDSGLVNAFRDFQVTSPAFKDSTKFKQGLGTGLRSGLLQQQQSKLKTATRLSPFSPRAITTPTRFGLGFGAGGFGFPFARGKKKKAKPTKKGSKRKAPSRSPSLLAIGTGITSSIRGIGERSSLVVRPIIVKKKKKKKKGGKK